MSSPPDGTPLTPDRIVKAGLCIGCGGCAFSTRERTMRLDSYGQYKPRRARSPPPPADETFHAICPFSPRARNEDELAAAHFAQAPLHDPRLGWFERAYVGHVEEGDFRSRGSSGGMATWTAHELLSTGRVDAVAHVAPRGSGDAGEFFSYRLSSDPQTLRQGAKSRYFPVELSDVLKAIRARPGRYGLVGVPCFIKAVRLLCEQDRVLAERIAFTFGLFCGHMKSARLVDSFAWQMDLEPSGLRSVDFRAKSPGQPANWYTAAFVAADGRAVRKSWWEMVDGDWGAGFFQNAACDVCDDVTAETADIAFGDAWVEPYASDPRGANVVVVRDRRLCDLIEQARAEGRLVLEEVDADFVARTQEAGLRQRREGLAYRLDHRGGLTPRKRVQPSRERLGRRRRIVYGLRSGISRWSHRMFWLARWTRIHAIYLIWARALLSLYQGLTYGRGAIGKLADACERIAPSREPPS